MNGPDRVREAIRRDRGEYAPSGPVVLCGVPDGTERRVDSWCPSCGRSAGTRHLTECAGLGLVRTPELESDTECEPSLLCRLMEGLMLGTWRRRRRCFHHDPVTGTTWLASELINMGSGKRFWCTHCGRMWFV